MEVIGFAASLATLLEISEVAVKLVHRLKEAPEELKRVASHLVHLSTQLQLLNDLQKSRLLDSNGEGDEKKVLLKQSIEQAKVTICHVSDAIKRSTEKHGIRGQVHWALLGREKIKSLQAELNGLELSLNVILSLVLCLQDARFHNMRTKLDKELFRMVQEWTYVRQAFFCHNAAVDPGTQEAVRCSHTNPSPWKSTVSSRITHSRHTTTESLTTIAGISALLTSTSDDVQSTYSLSLRLSLPLALKLVIDIVFRTYSSSWLNFSILQGSSISLRPFTSRDCDFMMAAAKGDVLTMRDLLGRRLAHPNSVTDGNITPMTLAIESGSVEAVRLLIQCGADINTLFGQRQTSPLAWAIGRRKPQVARLLLSYKASCQHISALGWSPLYYIWHDTRCILPSADEILILLAAEADFALSHKGLSDIEGFGVIHRAVIFGTLEEVTTLIRLGVSPFDQVGPLRWTAIHNAVFYGRYDIFLALLTHYQHVDIDTPDPRGWTLLHISASAGQHDITRHLLEKGADWRAKSKPSYSHMPEKLYGGQWTPAEVAGAQSLDRKRRFLEIVGEVLGQDAREDNDGEENWHDAVEEFCT